MRTAGMRRSVLIAVVAALCAMPMPSFALPESALEDTVCGAIKERLVFSLWRSAAGQPNPQAANRLANVSRVDFKTTDERVLHGYRIAAHGESKGVVLFAQGNAMLADQLLAPLDQLAQSGFDVHVYDFRGYGASQGKSRIKAMVSDYRELSRSLSDSARGKFFLYGVSFGGLLLLNALNSGIRVDGVVVDSAPSVISDEGCPATYDPVANVPPNAQNVLLIVGLKDKVLPAPRTSALADKVKANGGRLVREDSFAHPFMDSNRELAVKRLQLVTQFFAGR